MVLVLKRPKTSLLRSSHTLLGAAFVLQRAKSILFIPSVVQREVERTIIRLLILCLRQFFLSDFGFSFTLFVVAGAEKAK